MGILSPALRKYRAKVRSTVKMVHAIILSRGDRGLREIYGVLPWVRWFPTELIRAPIGITGTFTENRLRLGLVHQFRDASTSGVDEPIADLDFQSLLAYGQCLCGVTGQRMRY